MVFGWDGVFAGGDKVVGIFEETGFAGVVELIEVAEELGLFYVGDYKHRIYLSRYVLL